ncbi:MAG: hypothetical protein IJY10_04925 [Lachnospiraceae bacterium]|nr:hypothetical protein [Lachnospiraceae bacterium]
MTNVIELLKKNKRVDDYRINLSEKESYELFFVKGKLETVRRTHTVDKQVTVYVNHGEFKGHATFLIYPSTTMEEIEAEIEQCVEKALLIDNQKYELPANQQGQFVVESNFHGQSLNDIASVIADAVFRAQGESKTSLNSVEVFVNQVKGTVINSRGIDKTQVRYAAMVEAIPTYNGAEESVELYQQYNFNDLNEETITSEIAGKLLEVKARFEAKKPKEELSGKVILNKQELSTLFANITGELHYQTVYSKSNVFKKGDMIQKDRTGDPLNISMVGEVPNNIGSAKFDGDGMALTDIQLVKDGQAVAYYGDNRFGQYLGETPTGNLGCTIVEAGSACTKCLSKAPYLEVISMSGLQVDTNNDYIGGEVRLAYYNDGQTIIPVTGISITGKLSEVLSSMRLSTEIATDNSYVGPKKAILEGMKIF